MTALLNVLSAQERVVSELSKEIVRLRTENDTLRAEIERLRAERKTLWKQVPADEGTVMTYAAVHVVRWRLEFGEPACGFIQADREDGGV